MPMRTLLHGSHFPPEAAAVIDQAYDDIVRALD